MIIRTRQRRRPREKYLRRIPRYWSDLREYRRRMIERQKAIQRAKDAVAEIDAAGVQVKDLDIGLLDFPCMVGEEIVLLCWKLGEQGITHWHNTSEGFAGRKPIDERIIRDQKKSN